MFRPIAMVVPDSAMISEIILFGEGFGNTRVSNVLCIHSHWCGFSLIFMIKKIHAFITFDLIFINCRLGTIVDVNEYL